MDRVHACLDGKNLLEKVGWVSHHGKQQTNNVYSVHLYIFSLYICPQYEFAFCPIYMLVILPFIAYICFIDLSSVSFLCTVLKVEEDMDEGVLCEREDPEKMPFLGKDQTKKDEKGADGLQDAFEELTEEVMLALVVMFCTIGTHIRL